MRLRAFYEITVLGIGMLLGSVCTLMKKVRKTSIDLFGGYGQDEDKKVSTKIGGAAPKVEEAKEEEAKKTEDDTPAGYKKADAHTSIKVRQPPGGASSITF